MTLMTRWTLGLSLLIALGPVPSTAQVPLEAELREARTVYLERGSGVTRKTLDQIAQDIGGTARPLRWTVVADSADADIKLWVSRTSTYGGTMVAPLGGIGLVIPLENGVARLEVRPGAHGSGYGLLWDDTGTNPRKLVKSLLKRVIASGPPPPATPRAPDDSFISRINASRPVP